MDNVALESRCCVQGCCGETRDEYRHNRNAHFERNTERGEEIPTAVNKRTYLRFESVACPTADDCGSPIRICFRLDSITRFPGIVIRNRGCTICFDNRLECVVCPGTRPVENPHTDASTAGKNNDNSKPTLK